MAGQPQTLKEAIEYFSNPANCITYVLARRWPNGVSCPTCGSTEVHFLAKQLRWECRQKHRKRQFSAKAGTIFEDSRLGLDKWLCAIWMIANRENGVSPCEIHRSLSVTRKTAGFMLRRIRMALPGAGRKLSDVSEAGTLMDAQRASALWMPLRVELSARSNPGTRRVPTLGSRQGCCTSGSCSLNL